MSITVQSIGFEGPFTSTDDLRSASGVYLIHYENMEGSYTRLDVGESANVKNRIESHDRENCWKRNTKGTITFGADIGKVNTHS
jgi:hypothetical protein